MTRYRQ